MAVSATVRPVDGRPKLLIDGAAVAPIFYSLTDAPGGRRPWEERPHWNIVAFANAGVRLFCLDLWLAHIWSEDGRIDISAARSAIAAMTDVRADAAVLFRLHVNPPQWWLERHPEQWCGFCDTDYVTPTPGFRRPVEDDLRPVPRHSLVSETVQREVGEALAEFLLALEDSPEGDCVIGIHIADGVFGEYHQWAFLGHDPDCGPAAGAAFSQWLRDRYAGAGAAAVPEAWREFAPSFAGAPMPTTSERRNARDGIFRDPQAERRVIDYYRFLHQRSVDGMLGYCALVRRVWSRPILVGVFYGHFFRMFGRQAAGGHLELERVLAASQVDYLSAPQSYYAPARAPGGSGQSRGLVESCTAHGKLWLDEMDQATFLGHPDHLDFHSTLEQDLAILPRNIAHGVLRGGGLWYYDFGPHFSSGWWDYPDLMDSVTAVNRVLAGRARSPQRSTADVAAVFDTEVFYHLSADGRVGELTDCAHDALSLALLQSGAAVDMYHLSDLGRIDPDRYRAVVVANAWLLTDERRRTLAELERSGVTLLYSYLPGYTDGASNSLARVAEVVGMRLEAVREAGHAEVAALLQGAGGERVTATWSVGEGVRPLAGVRVDSGVAEHGSLTVSGEATGLAGVASRGGNSAHVWYCSLPPADPGFLATVFARAGVHLYGPPGDSYCIGLGLLCLHTATGGVRTITLPNGGTRTLTLAAPDTVLIDVDTGTAVHHASARQHLDA